MILQGLKERALAQKAAGAPVTVSDKDATAHIPVEASDKRLKKLIRQLSRAEAEIAGLKSSAAYRMGMFLTWPLRKVYRYFRPMK